VLLKLWPLLEPGRFVFCIAASDGNGNLFSSQSFLDWKEQGDYSPGWELMCPGNSIFSNPGSRPERISGGEVSSDLPTYKD